MGQRHGFGKLDPFLFCCMVWLMEQIIISRPDRCLTTDKSHDSSLHMKIQPKPEESRSTSLVTVPPATVMLPSLSLCSKARFHSSFQVVARSVKKGGKNHIIYSLIVQGKRTIGLQNSFPGTAKSSINSQQHDKLWKIGTQQGKLHKMPSFPFLISPNLSSFSSLCFLLICGSLSKQNLNPFLVNQKSHSKASHKEKLGALTRI